MVFGSFPKFGPNQVLENKKFTFFNKLKLYSHLCFLGISLIFYDIMECQIIDKNIDICEI